MLWNNPAVGQVTFGKNYTEWTARSTKDMDYWLTAADTPKEILENYTAVTGRAPKFPEDRMGLWQCKLRYRTQEEVLEVHAATRRKASNRSDCHRFLPLDRTGRLEIR